MARQGKSGIVLGSSSIGYYARQSGYSGFTYTYADSFNDQHGEGVGFYQYSKKGSGIDGLGDDSSWIDKLQIGLDVAGIADPTGLVDGVNALIYAGRGKWADAGISALAIIPYAGDAGKGLRYTKSTLAFGRETHLAYRAAEHAPELGKFKEYGKIPGIRPDFVDFPNKTIYELKPNNPRAIRAGEKQLTKYKNVLEAEYPGTIWNTVLDTY